MSVSTEDEQMALHDVNRSVSFRQSHGLLIGVIIWFIIAWFSHSSMINTATNSKPLERKENKRVYNLVENLCISTGMQMPKVNIIEDDSLNAFASGIKSKTFSVSLSRGIIDKLEDEELEAVIAHELTHIRNRDVRLLIISIVFVGIFGFISEMIFRSMSSEGLAEVRKRGGNYYCSASCTCWLSYGFPFQVCSFEKT